MIYEYNEYKYGFGKRKLLKYENHIWILKVRINWIHNNDDGLLTFNIEINIPETMILQRNPLSMIQKEQKHFGQSF